jgi:hypothetical protein
MSVLRELALAQAESPDMKARLDCGCVARPTMFLPCAWHRREFWAALCAACEEDTQECQGACCDPA